MDKIEKAFRKLSEKERRIVKEILLKLEKGDVSSLDAKKLKTRGDIFRVRKGDIRIIYRKGNAKQEIFILAIERRSEKTYRDFS
ncbi:MAG: type II toxin-antitoxin system RelE/ParE family toxin [Patescibacteria group bacterium]